jgi:hypothetical protein
LTGGIQTLDGSTTASATAGPTTTLTVVSTTNFDAGNYVKLTRDGGSFCAGSESTCYAKIVSVDSGTQLTISPALTFDNSGDTVTEVHIPEIGGTDLTNTLANRYGRGYFIDGIVTGNGSTYYSDNGITSSGTFTLNGDTQLRQQIHLRQQRLILTEVQLMEQ